MAQVKVIDNFYSNPNVLVELFSGKYPVVGCGNGKRTVDLRELDPGLYNKFCDTIFKVHNLDRKNHHVFTYFTEHVYNPIEVFNHNWVHLDGKNPTLASMTPDQYRLVLCGQIFMTPNPDPLSNVEICKVRPELNWSTQELIDRTLMNYTLPRGQLNSGKITQEEFEKIHDDYHANFENVCTVNNTYNRMVSWTAGTPHGAKQTSNMPYRLTQMFFIQSIVPLAQWPGDDIPCMTV